MAITKKPARLVTYYKTNTTTIDLTNDVKSIKIVKRYNTIGRAWLVLVNKTAYNSEGSAESDAYIRYDHDIKIQLDSNTGHDFYGIVVRKKANEDGTILIELAEYTILLQRFPVVCMNRIKVNKPFYHATAASGILTDDTATSILYFVQDSGVMNTAGARVKLALAIDDDVNTNKIYPFIKFGRGETCFNAVKKLADVFDYHFYIEKTLSGGSTVLTLYFKRKAYYSSGWLPATSNQITATWGTNMKDNSIEKINEKRVSRVVVYGNKEIGVMAIASGSSTNALSDETIEPEFNDITDFQMAQDMADSLLNSYRDSGGALIQRYSGNCDIFPLSTEHPNIDDHLALTDSRFNFAFTGANCIRVSGVELNYSDEENGYNAIVSVDDMGFDLVKWAQDYEKSKKELKDFQFGDSESDVCFDIFSDTPTTDDILMCDLFPEAASWSSPDAGEIKADWSPAANLYADSVPNKDTFTKYEILADTSSPPTTAVEESTTITDIALTATGIAADHYYVRLKITFGLTSYETAIAELDVA